MHVFFTDSGDAVTCTNLASELNARHYSPCITMSPAPANIPEAHALTDGSKSSTSEALREALNKAVLSGDFWDIMDSLRMCDVCIACTPMTPTMLLELGIAIGKGKYTIVLLCPGEEVNLLFRAADAVCSTKSGVLAIVDFIESITSGKNDRKNHSITGISVR